MRAEDFAMSCPRPSSDTHVQLSHGGGGRQMRSLIEKIFYPAFANPALQQRHDSATLEMAKNRIAFTTDSYVVKPLFFPGGDIGKLAVVGTVNDLAMAGATPQYLSAGFILEEGLELQVLERVVESMRIAASECKIDVVTGDTKVVDHGKGDGIFINTAGIGTIATPDPVGPHLVREGDAILLSGDVGRHGVAILSVREGLEFDGPIASDCAALSPLVLDLIHAGVELHCMRDLTRGGLASALNEIAMDTGLGIEIEETAVPVIEPVRGACELLGLDPLYVANEGRMIVILPEAETGTALEIIQRHTAGRDACRIGQIVASAPRRVVLRGQLGGQRILDLLSGEQLPRIC